jgi:hypothetical protein
VAAENAVLGKPTTPGEAVVGAASGVVGAAVGIGLGQVIDAAGGAIGKMASSEAGALFPKSSAAREAATLSEQLTMQEAKAGAGSQIMEGTKFGDPKFQGSGWQKMQHIHELPGGKEINVHYMKNVETGETTQFKFKNPPPEE